MNKYGIEIQHGDEDGDDHLAEDEEEAQTPTDEVKEMGTKRIRKMTTKGLAYMKERKITRLQQISRGLEKNMNVIMDLMDSDAKSSAVLKNYKVWLALFEDFLETDTAYRAMLTSEELEECIDDWFDTRNAVMVEFKETVMHWLAKNKRSGDSDIKSEKSSDVFELPHLFAEGSRHSSVRSRRSRKEDMEAVLEAKTTALKKRQELELEKLNLKMKEEQLKLEEECSNLYDEDTGSESSHRSVGSEYSLPSSSSSRHRQKSHFGSKISHNSCVSEALVSVVRRLNHPTVELSKFDGDPLHYSRFIRQFRTKIDENCDSYDDKLCYLEQYTTGEPQQIVIGCSYMDAKKGYRAAIKELDERYGDQEVIVNAYVNKALTWSVIRADNPKELDKFAVYLKECGNAVKSIDALKVLEYSENLKKLVRKLPFGLQEKWRTLVTQTKQKGHHVKFQHLVDFVSMEARKANDPTFGRLALMEKESTPQRRKSSNGSFAITTTANHHEDTHKKENINYRLTPKKVVSNSSKVSSVNVLGAESLVSASVPHVTAFTVPCIYCGDKHAMDVCHKLSSLLFSERINYLRTKGMCFGCLRLGHARNLCRCKAKCQKCNGMHPTVLHIHRSSGAVSKFINSNGSDRSGGVPVRTTSVGQCHMGAGDIDCAMAIIPVTLRSVNGMKYLKTYAFLDPGSNVSFCSERIAEDLGVSGKKINISMDTMGVTHKMSTQKIEGLEVSSLSGNTFIKLPTIYTKDKMPVNNQHIPTTQDISGWSHLQDITLPKITSEVGLLIGNNVPDAYTPLDVKTGPRGSPHAVKSLLGWIVWNVLRHGHSADLTVNRAEVRAIEQSSEMQQLDELYLRSLQLDFPERVIDDRMEPSQEDKLFTEKVQQSISLKEGHYELCLPFKDDVVLPDNHYQALQRLKSLRKKMLGNSKFCSDYVAFMDSIINKQYAVRVPEVEIDRCDGRVWYLPHHGIYHPRKPEKIRVVFDCAAQQRGVALNHVLLQGPDLMNNLIGVLLRFRQYPVAVMGDIEAMFHQVRVPRDDQDCLRFYWWPGGDLNAEPVIYRMVAHLFGAVSSPSCCIFALHSAARDNQGKFPDASKAILRNFYMDDFLASVPGIDDAVSLVKDVTKICSRGGFRLTKWVSNNMKVMESIPKDERAKGVQDIYPNELHTERALGVVWDIHSDNFSFNITENCMPATRRRMLSMVSSVFDPLGFAAPFILLAKILLQDLSRQRVGWDDELSDENLRRWKIWLADLPKLQRLNAARCLRPPGFGEVVCSQLHYFADASELGYGVAVYVRYTNSKGQVHIQLLISKARVSPLKTTTIPRLELTAAMVAVKMNRKLQDELDIKTDLVFFWTDSMAVLRYISNQRTRFHTFVANRLTVIREGSSIQQWHHVESNSNPADIVSRGLKADKLLQAEWWLNGPMFLRQSFDAWMQSSSMDLELRQEDPEVRKVVQVAQVTQDNDHPIDVIVQRCSSWNRLKRVVAWILLYIHQLKQRVKKEAGALGGVIDSTLIDQAEAKVLLHVQRQHYAQEFKYLEQEHSAWVKKNSMVARLDPVIGRDGLLRVGGRLCEATMSYEAQHPVILPRDSLISGLILTKIHKDVGHLGRNSILSALRQQYWIVGAGPTIRRLLSRCVVCRRYRAQAVEQKMADLPADRLIPDEPVFSRVGVDYFGPFQVKRGRSTVKRYGVIFTCLASRAVHIEVSYSLETDSCIAAIRRFIARRGQVQIMYSDNGTNLVGSERELRNEVLRWDKSKFGEIPQIIWKFNPPAGSHFGGVWERLIRSIRKILYSLVHQQTYHMDDEGLQTLFCEVESIMNNRPLTHVSTSPDDLEVITPNHLLLLRGGERLPCGTFSRDDNYPRRRWRQVQYLANQFWARWVKEYLPTLQSRQKWIKPQRNVSVGDIVLIVDNSPRNSWTLGRILEVMADRKGVIRVVKVKTQTTTLERPVHKLCMILEADIE